MKTRILEIIQALGISGAEFAKEIKISTGNLSDWTKGRVAPTTAALIRILQRYRVNINWLLSGEGEMFLSDAPIPIKHQVKSNEDLIKLLEELKDRLDSLEERFKNSQT